MTTVTKSTTTKPPAPARSEIPILLKRINRLATGDARRLWLRHKEAITLLSKTQSLLMEARAVVIADELQLRKWSEQALWAVGPAEYHETRDRRSSAAKCAAVGKANAREKAQQVWNEFTTRCVRDWVGMIKVGKSDEYATKASPRG